MTSELAAGPVANLLPPPRSANVRVSITAKRSCRRIIAGRHPDCDFPDGADFEAGPIRLRSQAGSRESPPYALPPSSLSRNRTEKLLGLLLLRSELWFFSIGVTLDPRRFHAILRIA